MTLGPMFSEPASSFKQALLQLAPASSRSRPSKGANRPLIVADRMAPTPMPPAPSPDESAFSLLDSVVAASDPFDFPHELADAAFVQVDSFTRKSLIGNLTPPMLNEPRHQDHGVRSRKGYFRRGSLNERQVGEALAGSRNVVSLSVAEADDGYFHDDYLFSNTAPVTPRCFYAALPASPWQSGSSDG
jgi:hypothetical protein